MPVRLQQQTDTSDDPQVIDLTSYETGRQNFRNHYFLEGCNSVFGGQDISVPWNELNNAVSAFCGEYSLDPSTIALRFVYCYSPDSTELFLRVQLLTMIQQSPPNENTYTLVDNPCAWYQVSDAGMVPTQDTGLNDVMYLTNFYYCDNGALCDVAQLQQLAGDNGTEFARTDTFPWQAEILQMYIDNGSPVNASICFGACSYVYINEGQGDIWPHGLVIYLKNAEGQDMLDDNTYIVLFENKGCDMGTLCPPYCNEYIAPTA